MAGRLQATEGLGASGVTWPGAAFVALGLLLGGALVAAGNRIYALEGGMSTVASLLPLGYAFAAGMVATANPCGILLVPSLVAYYLSRDDGPALTAGQRASNALLLGGMATLGFVSLFAVVGLVVGAGGLAIAGAFPVGGLIVGVVLAGLGLWLALSGESFGLAAASRVLGSVPRRDDPRSLFLFGIGYAVCSLSCTLPIFLVVAGSALSSGSALGSASQFVSYALGMGLVLTLVILAAAFFQRAVARSIRAFVPYVHRLAASFLLGAGLFMVHYWLVGLGVVRF